MSKTLAHCREGRLYCTVSKAHGMKHGMARIRHLFFRENEIGKLIAVNQYTCRKCAVFLRLYHQSNSNERNRVEMSDDFMGEDSNILRDNL